MRAWIRSWYRALQAARKDAYRQHNGGWIIAGGIPALIILLFGSVIFANAPSWMIYPVTIVPVMVGFLLQRWFRSRHPEWDVDPDVVSMSLAKHTIDTSVEPHSNVKTIEPDQEEERAQSDGD